MYPGDADTALQQPELAVGAFFHDLAHRLVAGRHWQFRWGRPAFDLVQLGMADAAGRNAYQQFPRARLWHRYAGTGQGWTVFVQRCNPPNLHGPHGRGLPGIGLIC